MALIITGTSGNDKIEVKRKNMTQVQVTINKKQITLQAAAFGHIYVYGGNGNDSISIQHLINKEAFLFGQNGRDTLKAGGGRTVLVGGSGNDSLTGGKRRDVLIGGLGSDAITGVVGDDIVIAGTTDHDANEMALCEILEEWSSGDSYGTRRATLSGTDAMPGLLHVSKVHDDGVQDKLEKTYDLDWYFANVAGGGVKDKVVKPNFSLITDI